MENARKAILELLLSLARIPSITCSAGEAEAGRFIHSWFSGKDYFRDHPENLRFIPVPGDPFGRGVVMAIVEAEPAVDGTVILTGHFDVVGTEDFGPLEGLAFSPLEYAAALKERGLDGEAGEDLRSGDFLFGRGVMDMKCGLAVEMVLLSEAAENLSSLGVNLLFLAVPDEEVGSAGMRAAVGPLAEVREERGFEYLGAILAEPGAASVPDVEGEAVFLGSVGKVMPFFYCAGIGTHAGRYFDGLSASLLASRISVLVEGNPLMADRSGDETAHPPACLYLRDIRDGYSVTIPDRAAVFFNYMTLTRAPAEIMGEMKKVAEEACEAAFEQIKSSGTKLGAVFDIPSPRIITFGEFAHETDRVLRGTAKTRIRELVEAMDPALDDRRRSLAVVSEMLRWNPPAVPLVIVGFLPPYYPHCFNDGKSEGDRRIRKAAESVVETALRDHGVHLTLKEYFAGICDLCYLGFQGSAMDMLSVASNIPGWGSVYRIALGELKKLDVPVLNLGPSGKDPHKATERLRLSYSLEIFPRLLREVVLSLARQGG
jgi:arginine utilization protein RocB